jgi:[ribosomal protein S18]-alanine N-acetyltransferase
VTIKIESTRSRSDIKYCAELMANSEPWSRLFFTIDQCFENLSSPALAIHVAREQGLVLGFLATRMDGIEGEPLVEYLCVDPRFRGKGLGTRLMSFAEERLFASADNIYLFVSDINPRAIELYERLDYRRVGSLPDYNLKGQTEYLYRKFRRPRQERMAPSGSFASALRVELADNLRKYLSLTSQQNEGFEFGKFDLASGYSRIPLPEALTKLVIDGTLAAMDSSAASEDQAQSLRSVVGRLLKLRPGTQSRVRPTFSGSIALDRVFAGLLRHAHRERRHGLTAVMPEPSIDLWSHLLGEHTDARLVGVSQSGRSGVDRVDQLIAVVEREAGRAPSRQLAVVLDSPSNPQGVVTSASAMKRLAEACGRANAVLVVDHCFLLIGLQAARRQRVATVFDLPDSICDWVGVWDTGKTIDVSVDKVGFIVSGNDKIAKIVDDALSVIQPSTYLARRTFEVFSRVLGDPSLYDYLKNSCAICEDNLRYLQSRVPSSWAVPKPQSGTFACVYIDGYAKGSDGLRDDWMAAGVSVAAGRAFFPTTFERSGEGAPFVRVSLLREPSSFRSAIDRAIDWWQAREQIGPARASTS